MLKLHCLLGFWYFLFHILHCCLILEFYSNKNKLKLILNQSKIYSKWLFSYHHRLGSICPPAEWFWNKSALDRWPGHRSLSASTGRHNKTTNHEWSKWFSKRRHHFHFLWVWRHLDLREASMCYCIVIGALSLPGSCRKNTGHSWGSSWNREHGTGSQKSRCGGLSLSPQGPSQRSPRTRPPPHLLQHQTCSCSGHEPQEWNKKKSLETKAVTKVLWYMLNWQQGSCFLLCVFFLSESV